MRLIPLMAMTALLAACAPDAPDTASTAEADATPPAAVESVPATTAAEGDTASASTLAYQRVNDAMHAGMGAGFTGDADVDFMRGMIPHHQGAIDMAHVVLEHGTDPEVRALAQQVIAAQETEIAQMQRWLQDRGLPADAPASDADAHTHH
ncbi:DUF305 domain-containing protein [Luteimonas fraxinea]|uniref:DUF305 domain-containing protein n=1 Tax=Luteimonas fraxinea TaxID=2901869 RepID=A0ABS8U957_9GAMM|nr:DUF305 domain-containing protein [Luteimonas fraxinea]MCD9096053.1 DUF305 domain-containing protein [Luteimonas fraxinea]UHH10775.1 DUF305 domain-containing protein [Luteimonas fraxinea]